jgi:hypothetical protein
VKILSVFWGCGKNSMNPALRKKHNPSNGYIDRKKYGKQISLSYMGKKVRR